MSKVKRAHTLNLKYFRGHFVRRPEQTNEQARQYNQFEGIKTSRTNCSKHSSSQFETTVYFFYSLNATTTTLPLVDGANVTTCEVLDFFCV